MKKKLLFVTLVAGIAIATAALGQVPNFKPVTQEMLLNPSPDDWLMYSRTYDAQRYSPLNQINRQNVGRLTQVWSNALPAGTIEIIPIVHGGVMYVAVPSQQNGMPRTAVQALDAATGGFAKVLPVAKAITQDGILEIPAERMQEAVAHVRQQYPEPHGL